MTTLKCLIQELCPDGVSYQEVENLLNKITAPAALPKSEYKNEGAFPVINQAQNLIAGYSDDEEKALPLGKYIVFGDHTRAIKWADFRFIPGESGTLVFKVMEHVEPKYVYYALKNLRIESRGYNRHWTVLREFVIPVPPIEVQKEIVRILDAFTELEAELETELEAELEARLKQFAHYTSQIFQDQKYNFELKKLGEIARCYAGATPLTTKNEYWDGGTIPWIASGEVNKGTIYASDAYITEKGYESSSTKMVPAGSVLIALAGQGKTRGMVARTRLEACTNQSLCAIVPIKDVNPDYLFFYMRTQYQNYRSMSSGEGGRGGLNLQIIKSIEIPVPSLQHQFEIVKILEKFEELSQGVSSSLPAEIVARRQQYEYYRSKLLTFKTLEVA